jgi:hypothetical protein
MPYNPYLLRFELDALQRRAHAHARRGRNLTSFWVHLETAESHLTGQPRFAWLRPQSRLRQAHQSGYAA